MTLYHRSTDNSRKRAIFKREIYSTFMCVSTVQNSADVNSAFYFFDSLGLVYWQALHKPYVLLTGQVTDFLLTSGPVEFSVFKPFVQQNKSVCFPQQHLKTVPAPAAEQKCTAWKKIKLVLLLDDGCKSVNGLPHIRMSADDVDIFSRQFLQHCCNPLSSASSVRSSVLCGSSISIPFLRMKIFSLLWSSDFSAAIGTSFVVGVVAILSGIISRSGDSERSTNSFLTIWSRL